MLNGIRRYFQRPPSPLISLVLPVKNGMPHVKRAIEALRRQTYRNFELLVQDGGSTDGTIEYLNSIEDLPRIEAVSQPDRGVGQAYNRGMARSKGELICLIAADEYLDDDALEKGVRWFRRHPQAAVIYGGMRLTDETGKVITVFIPPRFDLQRFLHNELFPTTAGFLNRERIGADLYYDETLPTCPDYDFWIRLGSKFGPKELVVVPEPIMSARGDRTSMSYRVESFDHFTRDKLFVLDRYVRSIPDESKASSLKASASCGILTWAAECVFDLEGHSPALLKWCSEVAKFDPYSKRLSRLARRSDAFEIGPSGQFLIKPNPQPRTPEVPTVPVSEVLNLDEMYSHRVWRRAKVFRGTPARVRTQTGPWNYSALIPLARGDWRDAKVWYWAKLNVQVITGQVGIGLLDANDIVNERLVSAEDGRVDVFVRLNWPAADGVMIRNGSIRGRSIVEIFSVTVETTPKAGTLSSASGK